MLRLVRIATVGVAGMIAAGGAVSPAATTTLPTLHLSAPTVVRVNHPYRVRAYGQTSPGQLAGLYIFIRKSGHCKTSPAGEARSGSYPAFLNTIPTVGPGTYSTKTPKTVFTKAHGSAKICGFLFEDVGHGIRLRIVRSIRSVTG